MDTNKDVTVNALTNSYGKKVNVILTPIKVINYIDKSYHIESLGLWDTGATNSCITKKHAQKLNLIPIQYANVTGVFGAKEVPVYYVNVTLNNQDISVNILVTECDSLSTDENVSMLIGMDIIGLGDFAISNYNGETTMSFRRPSIAKTDYVHLLKQSKPANTDKVGRNDPCPCGSGKKYKNCHGKNK